MKKIGVLKTYTSSEIADSYVSIGFECLDRELFTPEKCYDLLAKTGVKYARCQTGWARCEKSEGVYTFEWLDSVVDNLLERGVKPWFNVGFGNPVYMPDAPNPTAVGCVPLLYGEKAIEAWKNYVCELAKRYKGKVKHFEIWNEADVTHFWHPEPPCGEKYAQLIKITAPIIRSIVPGAKIGANISSPRSHDYAAHLLDALDAGDIDFFAFHFYSSVPEFRYDAYVSLMRRMLDKRGFKDVELWQGEGGYPSWAYKGHWLVKDGCDNERAQAVWQLRRVFADVAAGLKISSFFQMVDMWEKPYGKAEQVIEKPAAHGILHGIEYTPKESYKTITNLAAIFSGGLKPCPRYMHTELVCQNVLEMLSVREMTFEKNGFPVYAYYLPTDVSKSEDIFYTANVGVFDAVEQPVLLDTYSGEVFEIDNISILTPRCELTTYHDLPVKDYPLIITDRRAFKIV